MIDNIDKDKEGKDSMSSLNEPISSVKAGTSPFKRKPAKHLHINRNKKDILGL